MDDYGTGANMDIDVVVEPFDERRYVLKVYCEDCGALMIPTGYKIPQEEPTPDYYEHKCRDCGKEEYYDIVVPTLVPR